MGDDEEEYAKIHRAKMQFVQNTLNHTLQGTERNEDIRAQIEVKDVNAIISINRSQWCDHLERMTEDRLPKAALNYKAVVRKDAGRPKMRWEPEQVYIS